MTLHGQTAELPLQLRFLSNYNIKNYNLCLIDFNDMLYNFSISIIEIFI